MPMGIGKQEAMASAEENTASKLVHLPCFAVFD